jgi:hypothetical protein
MISKIKNKSYIFVFIFFSIIIFFTNYKDKTFLIGWDNLFPEFNFKLNIIRDFFGVWQHYRGVGALDNFSYPINLSHNLIRFLISIFFKKNLIRWFFIFLMHFIG